ncbi:MAG: glycosyltransferase, partial [Candidatus Omnitrophica bacterium]|nr:glycosyltransferase [Candidatus Omnitrophota bacterium]
IVGKPEDASRDIMYMIDKFALKNHVKMLGIRKDIPEILDISDIFALPSLWEGLANVLLEAMSAKLPIVATNIEANCEVIENNKTGILVPPKNSTAIADAIAELLGNKNEARKLGEAAYLSVVNNYTVDKLVRNHERFYKQIRERNAAIRNTT